ncbi:MAG: FoF1 ATP synthase subunit delta/epsilon [Planctomycetota bacterium]
MTLTVTIITPERSYPPLAADHVTLPAFDGQVGIRTGHAAMICQLGEGLLHVKKGAGDIRYHLAGGIARIEDDTIQILAERVSASDD